MSYNIKFISLNSEYLSRTFTTLSGDFIMEFKLTSDVSANTQVVISGGTSRIILYSLGRLYILTDTDPYFLSGTNWLPTTGAFLLKLVRTGTNIEVFVDDISVGIAPNMGGDFGYSQIAKFSSQFFEGTIEWFKINSEIFTFPEGSGSTTTGSEGTVLTLHTDHADGIDWINTKMWVDLDLRSKLQGLAKGITNYINIVKTFIAGFGYYGATEVKADYSANGTTIYQIRATEASVVNVYANVGSDISSVSLDAGKTLIGNYSKVDCVSGSVLVYPLGGNIILS